MNRQRLLVNLLDERTRGEHTRRGRFKLPLAANRTTLLRKRNQDERSRRPPPEAERREVRRRVPFIHGRGLLMSEIYAARLFGVTAVRVPLRALPAELPAELLRAASLRWISPFKRSAASSR